MRFIREPGVYLVARPSLCREELERFLADHGAAGWETDAPTDAEKLCEAAGRICYMSFGKGRKTNREYLNHILEVGHGSVLEHAVWSFVITGVSRSFTHELVRHRAGFSYSQLSQRYVDESETDFVEPACIAEDPDLHAAFAGCCRGAKEAYAGLSAKLAGRFGDVPDKTLRRKLARQAARAILPNATETRIFVSANARAWRNFIELRASEHAETEIRKVALEILRILQREAPNIFGDYVLRPLPDGTFTARTAHRKV